MCIVSRRRIAFRSLLAALGLAGAAAPLPAAPGDWFGIRVVDAEDGRPVPLVELETVNRRRFVSDNAGWVAVQEPGLRGQRVWFTVRSHGYAYPADAFGATGLALVVTAGGRAEIRLPRRNVAQRVARLTGEGGWRDSVLLGEPVPAAAARPLLNAQVLGQDSVQTATLGDRRYWFWGDTQRASHPLGHFRTAGATTAAVFDPEAGITYDYFTGPDGFSRGVVTVPGPGMVWLDGVLTAPDAAGVEYMFAHFSRMKSLDERVEHGLVAWDAVSNAFIRRATWPAAETWRHPAGHALRVTRADGDWYYFAQPFCTVRVPARAEAVSDPARYEAWTDGPTGACWSAAGPPRPPRAFALHRADGRAVVLHSGSVAWNDYARQWLMIAVEQGGAASYLGDVWLAAAPVPEGPWRLVCPVVSHDRYSFYNPVHHAFLDRAGGRVIYFEGTFAETFSGAPAPWAGADYNQVLYRLDLAAVAF